MKIAFAIGAAAAAFALSGCHFNFNHGVKGSGKVVSEDRKVGEFSEVELRGAGELDIEVGPAVKVTIKTDDNIAKLVETRVEGGKLIIDTKEPVSPTEYKIVIQTPSLELLEIQGAGDANVRGIHGKSFAAKISGAGGLVLAGKVEQATFSIRGAGDVSAYELDAESVEASVSGAGQIHVSASKTLDADLAGAGEIRYRGNPTVTKSVDGAGSIEKE
jgi:hypothetical protein